MVLYNGLRTTQPFGCGIKFDSPEKAIDMDLNLVTKRQDKSHRNMIALPSPYSRVQITVRRASLSNRNNTITDGGVAPQCTFARPT